MLRLAGWAPGVVTGVGQILRTMAIGLLPIRLICTRVLKWLASIRVFWVCSLVMMVLMSGLVIGFGVVVL